MKGKEYNYRRTNCTAAAEEGFSTFEVSEDRSYALLIHSFIQSILPPHISRLGKSTSKQKQAKEKKNEK